MTSTDGFTIEDADAFVPESKPTRSRKKKEVQEDDGWRPPMPDCWKLAEELLAARVPRVMLSGIPGTGKTFAGKYLGVQPGERVVSIYVRDDSAEYQIVGADIFHKDGSSGWRNGPALIAMLEGERLVVNEVDHASGDALDALMGICDDPESAGWMLPTGEVVTPAEGFQVVATMNGKHEDLPVALAERFVVEVEITHPHPEAIMALPFFMRRLAWDLSHAGVDESQRVPIRAFREFARAMALGVNEKHAARAVFGPRAVELTRAMEVARQDDVEGA